MDPKQLSAALTEFTGTAGYTRLCPKTVLTDGALFLAEQGQCFWLLDVFASHLLSTIDGEQEPFTCLKMTKQGDAALIMIDDGNGVDLASQEIEYINFPLEAIKLYGCWSEDYWIIMLPSEY